MAYLDGANPSIVPTTMPLVGTENICVTEGAGLASWDSLIASRQLPAGTAEVVEVAPCLALVGAAHAAAAHARIAKSNTRRVGPANINASSRRRACQYIASNAFNSSELN